MKLAFVWRFEGMNTLTHFPEPECACVRACAHVHMCVHDAGGRQRGKASSPQPDRCVPSQCVFTDCDRMRSVLQLNRRGGGGGARVSLLFRLKYRSPSRKYTFGLNFRPTLPPYLLPFCFPHIYQLPSACVCLRPCRHLEPGRHPLHAGVRSAALPGGQRQRDAHHDHGLQIHRAAAHLPRMPRVSTERQRPRGRCIFHVRRHAEGMRVRPSVRHCRHVPFLSEALAFLFLLPRCSAAAETH